MFTDCLFGRKFEGAIQSTQSAADFSPGFVKLLPLASSSPSSESPEEKNLK
jgi:hypothetical protein